MGSFMLYIALVFIVEFFTQFGAMLIFLGMLFSFIALTFMGKLGLIILLLLIFIFIVRLDRREK